MQEEDAGREKKTANAKFRRKGMEVAMVFLRTTVWQGSYPSMTAQLINDKWPRYTTHIMLNMSTTKMTTTTD